MSLSAPAWRLASRCSLCSSLPIRSFQHQQRRAASNKEDNDSTPGQSSNPVLDEFQRNNPDLVAAPGTQSQQRLPQQGDIAPSSIFEDEHRAAQRYQSDDVDPVADSGKRDPHVMARVLHPDPNARERWERKKVIQMIKKGGRLTKDQFIKRTEREHLVKSHNMKTSTKKLGMIARQIAGKTIDDAITQMRFSNKKVAQEVLKQLEFARDEAVVMRGMGLGSAANRDPEGPDPESSSSSSSAAPPAPLSIQLKDGKRHTVDDRSKIYIDQAWVGRGPYGQLPDYRARGRVYVMRTPWTSLSVVLKEEVTRVRQHEEREAKRKKKITEKVWVHLPDRPIQTHRQWFSW